MKMKWLPMLKPDQNSSQELKKSHLKLSRKKILTSQLVKKTLLQQESKVNELITSLSLLKMEKQQKQSLIAR